MLNIYKKLHAIFSEAEGITKDMQVGGGGYGYKAVSEAEVLNKVKPLMRKYKVLIIPIDISVDTQFNAVEIAGKVKTTTFTELIVTYDVIDCESGEKIQCKGIGHGIDAGDKASGKASTYADKNVMLRLFKMFSGEDTDNTHSDDLQPAPPARNALSDLINDIKNAKTTSHLKNIHGKYSQYHKNGEFMKALAERKEQLLKK